MITSANTGVKLASTTPKWVLIATTQEYRCAPFEVLVNRDNFEFLEWKLGSYGSLPQNSIGTCSGGDKYIGMSKYGLGKVHTTHRAFYLPWK
eukprot:superscaffoldBa00016142_g26782